AEAVPRRDHRLVTAARVHLPDGPRRVPHRRGDRALYDVQGHRDALVPRDLGEALDRALPAARADEGPAHLDGSLRPVARLQPDPRAYGDRQLPRLRGLGDVRLQGSADRGRDARGADRERGDDAGADRALRTRGFSYRNARVRTGRSRGEPLREGT